MNQDTVRDRARYCYTRGTLVIAGLQYRIAELVGAGAFTDEIGMELQHRLGEVWEWFYSGTLSATGDHSLPDELWDEADSTYSDGRPVRLVTRFELLEVHRNWVGNGHVLETGAILENPRRQSCVLTPEPGGPCSQCEGHP